MRSRALVMATRDYALCVLLGNREPFLSLCIREPLKAGSYKTRVLQLPTCTVYMYMYITTFPSMSSTQRCFTSCHRRGSEPFLLFPSPFLVLYKSAAMGALTGPEWDVTKTGWKYYFNMDCIKGRRNVS